MRAFHWKQYGISTPFHYVAEYFVSHISLATEHFYELHLSLQYTHEIVLWNLEKSWRYRYLYYWSVYKDPVTGPFWPYLEKLWLYLFNKKYDLK